MYPLTFNSEEEHRAHVLQNTDFYVKILKYKDYHELIKSKKSGDVSVLKGKAFENIIDLVLTNKFKDVYEIINNSKTRRMDLRIKHLTKGYSIGIECKDKKIVSKADIDKFKRDKLENKFKKSIFISTSKIPKLLTEEDTCTIVNDELYIYSNDVMFIDGIICCFLSNIEEDEIDCVAMIDQIVNLYNHWKSAKKALHELDKAFVDTISMHDKDLLKGHHYFTPMTSIKK